MTGNKPPGQVPNKFLYMTKDLDRLAGYFGVPLQAPSDPFEAMFEKGEYEQGLTGSVMYCVLISPWLTWLGSQD